MTHEQFEQVAQEAFDSLPEKFRFTFDNVRIVVEESDDPARRRKVGIRSGAMLLGLYEGVPLSKRGLNYGMYPVVPDTITLFKRNIESVARSDDEVRRMISDVLIHEIAHFYGMDEDEVREAGF
jgi:predicted Zn-dependent protease with MMP-like domain